MINRSSENVAQFEYLGMTVTNQNLIAEEIKRRLDSVNACHNSVQELFVFFSGVYKVKNWNV
jgi:hypothetical protein